jgi:hypothetical protein
MRRSIATGVAPSVALVAGATALLGGAGCVERRIVITSEPPGAAVTLNDVDVGLTPLGVDFTYFGTYDVQVRKPGYEPLLTAADASAPWYEWPGIDIVSQAIPPTDRTVVRWHFDLEPVDLNEAALLDRARETRDALGGAESRASDASPEADTS